MQYLLSAQGTPVELLGLKGKHHGCVLEEQSSSC